MAFTLQLFTSQNGACALSLSRGIVVRVVVVNVDTGGREMLPEAVYHACDHGAFVVTR
jgi:hypothetical protein